MSVNVVDILKLIETAAQVVSSVTNIVESTQVVLSEDDAQKVSEALLKLQGENDSAYARVSELLKNIAASGPG